MLGLGERNVTEYKLLERECHHNRANDKMDLMFTPELCRRRHWRPTPVLLPGKSHGWRSLVGCSPWSRKSRTWMIDFTFTFHFHALEKDMATPSSVLAWRIPGTGEPGGLPSVGLQRVGHDWRDLAVAARALWRLFTFLMFRVLIDPWSLD